MKKIAAAFIILGATGNANAMLVNIDFQPTGSTLYGDQGILGGSGDATWNSVDIGVATNLTLADNSGLSGIGVNTGGFTNSYANLTSSSYPATNPLLADRIVYLTADYTQASLSLTGLTPGSLYNIVVYNAFYAQEYSVGGDTATTDPKFASPSSGDSVYPYWTQGVEYARLDALMADAGGNLVISVTPQDGANDITGTSGANELGYASIAALQIQSVPLPAAVYLFGTGLLGLAGIARRKKA